jgi:hypothetical protein
VVGPGSGLAAAAAEDEDLRNLSTVGRALARVAGPPVALALGAVAAARRGKAVHPDGVVHEGTLVVPGDARAPRGARLFAEAGEHLAVIRFSRSIGLPRPLPDLLGLSIRLPDVYGPGRPQDLLLVSSADLPIVHHVFLPSDDVQARPYTSSLPYRAGEETFLVGALPHPDSPRPEGRDEFDRLAKAAALGLRLRIAVSPVMGRFRPVAELRVGARLPRSVDALRFHPGNSGGGMHPVGALNAMRDLSYPLSQAAWRRTRGGAARQQEEADRELARRSGEQSYRQS